jgi:hypothetical protein
MATERARNTQHLRTAAMIEGASLGMAFTAATSSRPMWQTCLNTVGPSLARCSLNRMARRLALPSSLASHLISSSHTVEKLLFFARRVTLGSSIIRFMVMAMITPIVPSHRRGRTSVIRVKAAHLTVGRRPALGHRRVAASIVRGGSERDDVQANGISRIISLSPGVPCC